LADDQVSRYDAPITAGGIFMQIKRIPSSALPDLAATVKEIINHGRWSLYRLDPATAEPGVAYVVKGGDHAYWLDHTGQVLRIDAGTSIPAIAELVYFTDVSQPPSLSERPLHPCCAHHAMEMQA
jgi:hypothetical protein